MTFDNPTFDMPANQPPYAENPPEDLITDVIGETAIDPPVPEALPVGVGKLAALRIPFTLDAILYVAFLAFALVFRLIGLGTIVLNDAESHEALAVFRALNPAAPGSPLTSHQPLVSAANTLIMLIGGDSNLTARLATVLVGAGIVLIPLLYRRWIGRVQSVIASGLLAVSPVLLTASRTMSGAVWSIALGLIGGWLIGRFVETGKRWIAVIASAVIVILLVATEQAGFLIAIMLAIGVIVALTLSSDPSEGARVRLTLRGWPWLSGFIVSAIVLGVIGTAFWLNPAGLGAIGDTVSRGLRGFTFAARPAGTPFAYPLLTSVFYEPILWVFGLIGAWQVTRGHGGFIHRLFFGWLLAAIVLSFLYSGAEASNALWLTIPLIGLSALVLEQTFAPVTDAAWKVPAWGPWLHALGTVAVLAVLTINLLNISQQSLKTDQPLGAALASLFANALSAVSQPTNPLYSVGIAYLHSLVWVGLAVLFGAILYFLVGSIWGSRTAGRGFLLGLLIFFTAYGLSAGLQASITHTDDPRELWRINAVSQNLNILDTQLTDTSIRASGMRSTMAITVVGSDDSPIAWIVRRFNKTVFVSDAGSGINAPAVILPSIGTTAQNNKPILGAAYVGETFSVHLTWDRSTLQAWDLINWIYNRATRVPTSPADQVTLWVRSDVYGVPADSLTNPASTAPVSP